MANTRMNEIKVMGNMMDASRVTVASDWLLITCPWATSTLPLWPPVAVARNRGADASAACDPAGDLGAGAGRPIGC
jgi:hypothetical protein